MAKDKTPFQYGDVEKKLKENGLGRLYLLWGEEDYLKQQYIDSIMKMAFPNGDREFNFHLIDSGKELDIDAIASAVDAMPFMSDHSVVMVRDADLNSVKEEEYERLNSVLSDLPDYCTLIFTQQPDYTPDKRLKTIRSITKNGEEIQFYASGHDKLVKWITRHFKAHDKTISGKTAEYLIFNCGDLMNRLLPEIEKVAAYSSQEEITTQDIDAVTTRIPEASVFLITDYIAERKNNEAAAVLSDLLSSKENDPIMLLALIGNQMRRLYGAKLAAEHRLGRTYLEETCGAKGWLADRLTKSAARFRLDALRHYVSLCAEADYKMKSSSIDDREILMELLMHICSGEIV